MKYPTWNATDVVGYTYDSDIYCTDCGRDIEYDDEKGVIFADSEWDYQPVCCDCGCEIEGVTVLVSEDKDDPFLS